MAGNARPSRRSKEAPMTAPFLPNAPLSPRWAFVVQLREGTALTPEGLHGRLEHVVSGRATFFTGLEELRAFMAEVLAQGTPPHTLMQSTDSCDPNHVSKGDAP